MGCWPVEPKTVGMWLGQREETPGDPVWRVKCRLTGLKGSVPYVPARYLSWNIYKEREVSCQVKEAIGYGWHLEGSAVEKFQRLLAL